MLDGLSEAMLEGAQTAQRYGAPAVGDVSILLSLQARYVAARHAAIGAPNMCTRPRLSLQRSETFA